jgi:hypothetical protein
MMPLVSPAISCASAEVSTGAVAETSMAPPHGGKLVERYKEWAVDGSGFVPLIQ